MPSMEGTEGVPTVLGNVPVEIGTGPSSDDWAPSFPFIASSSKTADENGQIARIFMAQLISKDRARFQDNRSLIGNTRQKANANLEPGVEVGGS